MSGVVSTFIATPADMVKTRILTSGYGSSGSSNSVDNQYDSIPIPVLPVYDSTDIVVGINNGNNNLGVSWQGDGSLLAATSLSVIPGNGTVSSLLSSSSAVTTTMDDYEYSSLLMTSDTADKGKYHPNNDENPLRVAQAIVDREGANALFRGVHERCLGAIPRFGITLGVHEWLEHYAAHVGLLSSSSS